VACAMHVRLRIRHAKNNPAADTTDTASANV
jgi:hypothetical protein